MTSDSETPNAPDTPRPPQAPRPEQSPDGSQAPHGSQGPRDSQAPRVSQQTPQDRRSPRKESLATTCGIQALGLIAALAAVLWVFRKRALQLLGIAWVFAAFIWFFRFQHFNPDRLVPFGFSWPWHTRPAWVDYLSLGWNGMPWAVIVQGALALWIAGVAAALGWRLMRVLRPGTDWAGGVVWGGALVLGGLAMGVFGIGVAGGLTHARALFGVILAALSLIAVWSLWRPERKTGRQPGGWRPEMGGTQAQEPPTSSLQSPASSLQAPASLPNSLSRAEWGIVAGTAALQFLAFLYTLTPEVQSDAIRYHLAAPQEWLKAGRLSYLPYNAFSNFPSNIEMLFLFGLGLAGDLLAKAFHFLFLPLTTGAVALITREIVGSGRTIARTAVQTTNSHEYTPMAVSWGEDESHPLGECDQEVQREIHSCSLVSIRGSTAVSGSIDVTCRGDSDAIHSPQSAIRNPQSSIANPQSAAKPSQIIRNPQSPPLRPWWHIRAPLLAAGAWGTLPITIPLAGWGFIDLGVTCFALGLVFFLLRWTRTRTAGDWMLAAAFGGLLCGSKYTGVVMVFWSGLLLALFGLLRPLVSGGSPTDLFGHRALRSLWRAAMFGAVAAAIASPWWIKNYAYTGNPVYPMAYSVFGGGEWNEDLVRLYHEKTQEKGVRAISRGPLELLKNTCLLPWLTLTDSDLFERFEIGPLFWVFFPWILVWCLWSLSPRAFRGSHAPPLLALWMLCFCVFWFFSYQSNRFFLPGWALCAVMIAATLARVGQWHSTIRAVCLIGFLLPVLYGGLDSARWLLFDTGRLQFERKGNQVTVRSGTIWPAFTLGFLNRQDYLALHLNYARAAEYCSARLKPTDKVLLVGEHRKMHWNCRVEGNDWFDQPRILPYLNQAGDAGQLLDVLLAAGYTHIFFNLDEWGWPGTAASARPGELPRVPRGSAWDYNGRHFSPANIALLRDLLKSSRLKVLQSSNPGRVYVAEILPGSPAAPAQPK